MADRRLLRTAAAVLAFPATYLASRGLVSALDVDALGLAAAIFLVPAGVYGAAVMHAWALTMPLVWAGIYLAGARIVDLIGAGGCSVCGSDMDWSTYPLMVLLFAGTLTLAVAVGAYIAITISDRREAR